MLLTWKDDGIAGFGEDSVIGNSFQGSREERFSGHGNLLIADNNRVKYEIEMPAAQIYDVILCNGDSFDTPPAAYDFESLCSALEANFGRAVLECDLDQASVSEKGKKFDERDRGQIDELR